MTLERWCEEQHLSSPATVVAVRDRDAVQVPTAEQLRRLAADGRAVRYRRVKLTCGGHLLALAHNWFLPGRLAPEMVRQLDNSDVAFGRVVQSLRYRRRTLSSTFLWEPERDEQAAVPNASPGDVPRFVLEHRALLVLPGGEPISEVWETYTSVLLGFSG
jgi:chorismate-pyruvate lyase